MRRRRRDLRTLWAASSAPRSSTTPPDAGGGAQWSFRHRGQRVEVFEMQAVTIFPARARCRGSRFTVTSTAAVLLPRCPVITARDQVLPANKRVIDGTRTRDLRSHNPSNAYSARYASRPKTSRLKLFRGRQSIHPVPLYTARYRPYCCHLLAALCWPTFL
jgi:hypothetical protein